MDNTIIMQRHPRAASGDAEISPGTTAPDERNRRVYHVSPWRMLLAWLPIGPLSVGCAVLALFVDAADDRAALLFLAASFGIVTLAIVAMVRRARLEITPQRICLRQIGYRFEARWSDIVAVRVGRGREGFVTVNEVEGRGATLVAASASIAPYGLYNDDQQRLLDQHRLIPIEAFAWHLRHGPMRAEIAAFAPHLATDLAQLDDQPGTPAAKSIVRAADAVDRRRQWLAAALIAGSLVVSGVLIAMGERAQQVFFDSAYGLLDPFFAASSGLATWQMLKRRAWLLAGLMALMTLVMVGWTLLHWSRLFG